MAQNLNKKPFYSTFSYNFKFFIKTTSSFNEITVSYIGYKKVNIPISNNTNYIKIELNSSTESLNEIIITAKENPAIQIIRSTIQNKKVNNVSRPH